MGKGFHFACDDVGANRRYVAYPGSERYPMSNNVEAVGVIEFLKMVATASRS